MRRIRFRVKILAVFDTESEYAIHCTWVLPLHLHLFSMEHHGLA